MNWNQKKLVDRRRRRLAYDAANFVACVGFTFLLLTIDETLKDCQEVTVLLKTDRLSALVVSARHLEVQWESDYHLSVKLRVLMIIVLVSLYVQTMSARSQSSSTGLATRKRTSCSNTNKAYQANDFIGPCGPLHCPFGDAPMGFNICGIVSIILTPMKRHVTRQWGNNTRNICFPHRLHNIGAAATCFRELFFQVLPLCWARTNERRNEETGWPSDTCALQNPGGQRAIAEKVFGLHVPRCQGAPTNNYWLSLLRLAGRPPDAKVVWDPRHGEAAKETQLLA